MPIIPDEARTFGMDALFKEFGIYASQGQRYEPVDHDLMLSYQESTDGQILEEGITEAGGLASWTAAATSYAHRGVPMVPFFTFYSMFGFQRVGDLIWAAADARARGFLMGATAGRTTLLGEGLQHQDGHSQLLASTVPVCRSYDPAFAYETALIIRDGLHRMYPDGDPTARRGRLLLPDRSTTRTTRCRRCPRGWSRGVLARAVPLLPRRHRWRGPSATILFSGTSWGAATEAQRELAEHYGVGAELWSATSYQQLRMEALEVERWNRLHPGDGTAHPRG